MDAPPTGTFNYTDDREYTPAEAIDLLNSVLLTKGYTLVRRQRMLMVINLQDGIPPNLVPMVALGELDKRGEFELVSTLFSLEKISPEEAETEAKKLLGPEGTVVVLPGARQIMVTETAGRLRTIRDTLKRLENSDGSATSQVRAFDLKHANPQNVLEVLRQLLDIPVDKTAALDGSIHFAVDNANQRLLVSGRADKMVRVQEILKTLDVPDVASGASTALEGSPQLEVYPIAGADPDSVLKVIQTLLAGNNDVHLALDPKTNSLVALARPSLQATIRATLEQMQRDGRRIEVIPLHTLEAQAAVTAIKKLFGEGTGPNIPQIEADPNGRQLLVQGTEAQIQQIHALLIKMGESPQDIASQNSTVRVLPLTGNASRSALERIQEIWPTLHPNKVQVVRPSMSIPTVRPSSDGESSAAPPGVDPKLLESLLRLQQEPANKPTVPVKPSPVPSALPPGPQKPAAPTGKTAGMSAAHVFFVADQQHTTEPPAPPILVVPGPGGILIACPDAKALNEFEQLFNTLASSTLTPENQYTIFYLKHAKAAAVSETLENIYGLSHSSDASGMGMGMGGMGMGMGMGMGGEGGGLFGALPTTSPTSTSGSTSTIPVKITPDSRLNALIVQASPADLDTIQELIKVLDEKESPEDIDVASRPRVIPLRNVEATEVANTLRQLYQDRMVTGGPGGPNGQQPSPAQLLQLMRGGRRAMAAAAAGNPNAQRGKAADEPPKMSVGVDTRSNALIVIAPDPLFQEVKQLVEQLDDDSVNADQTMRVVTLQRTSLSSVQQALSSIAGGNVQMGFASGMGMGGMGMGGMGMGGMGAGMAGMAGMGRPFSRGYIPPLMAGYSTGMGQMGTPGMGQMGAGVAQGARPATPTGFTGAGGFQGGAMGGMSPGGFAGGNRSYGSPTSAGFGGYSGAGGFPGTGSNMGASPYGAGTRGGMQGSTLGGGMSPSAGGARTGGATTTAAPRAGAGY